jgi:membrane protease YdiL (CAAX protease family)
MRITAIGREPLPLTAWPSLRVFLWYFGTQLVVAGILGMGLAIWAGASSIEADLTTKYLIPITVIGVVVAALVMLRKARKSFSGGYWPTIAAALGWRPASRRDFWLAFSAGVLLAGCSLVLTSVFPPRPGQSFGPVAEAASSSQSSRILLALLAVFFAPPTEEFLFRGILLSGFGRSWGTVPAAAVVSILFAVGHVVEARSYWPALLCIFLLGVITLVFRLRTRSLWPGIGMHSSYNAVLMMVMLQAAG